MSKKSEDVAPKPSAYPYSWSPESASDLPLKDFLTKYKPSMVQDDGTKPWLWVRGSRASSEDMGEDAAIEEAAELLTEVTAKVEQIKNDKSIPVRSNKKTGAKSKKELRETEQASATEKLKVISVSHGYVSGKWLIFAPSDKVDTIWSTVATSLISGPLSATSAFLAKVATCPQSETPSYQHVLYIYLPNVYDKDAVTEVMRVLLRKHGLNILGVKIESIHIYRLRQQTCKWYTVNGKSGNPLLSFQMPRSGHVLSLIFFFFTAAVITMSLQSLKEAYFAELASSKTDKDTASKPENSTYKVPTTDGDKQDEQAKPKEKSKPKPKPKLKLKKQAADDPFASDEDENGDDNDVKSQKPAKRVAPETEGEEDEPEGSKSKRPRSK
ncbi:hypothetical protein EW146_g2822 [Bondarzewia mesenterica]|uniref:Uncharacterized protein n=1 Tax=Bondarzewia mesenterica TaxID=1095465 RepID=A0A4V3XFM7_9AGAM|nr:hypothetical protein EW146_g2822 [Bondarzewia mesenterica]